MQHATNLSNIQIYHNYSFPLEYLIDLFHDSFGSDYSYNGIFQMITSANNIFCSYDPIQHRYIACAIVNNIFPTSGLHVVLFGVRQQNQQRGVGKQLLTAIVGWARQTEYSFISLNVNFDNTKAISLYEKVGFRKQQYLPDYYKGTPKNNPAGFLMLLSLD